MSPLLSDNGWTDCNAELRIVCDNTVDEKITTATNLVNFGPVTLRSCGSFAYVVSALCWFLKVIHYKMAVA